MAKKQKHWTDRVIDLLTKAALRATSFNVDISETKDIGRVIDLVVKIQLKKLKSAIVNQYA